MAKKDDAMRDRVSYDEAHARLARGDNVAAGWCLDFDRDPYLFECGEEEEAIAMGDVSVSWDGSKVTNLKTGEVKNQDPRPVVRPVTLQEMSSVPVAATGADTANTGNPPPGGGGTRTAAGARA